MHLERSELLLNIFWPKWGQILRFLIKNGDKTMGERRDPGLIDRVQAERLNAVSLAFPDKDEMVRQAMENIRKQGHVLEASNREVIEFSRACIDEIERLHNVPDIIQNPSASIDVIWIISAPGLLLEHGSKPGWSAQFPWLDDCEWEVVGAGFALAEAITASRLRKPINQLTKEDAVNEGPWIIYNSNAWENEFVETILNEAPSLSIATEKVSIYQPRAKDPAYVRTLDQARDIRIPDEVRPGTDIAICVLAAQWVRLGRYLAAAQSLPGNTNVIVIPVSSPKGHEREHAIMETQGALVSVYKNHDAVVNPIGYRIK